MTTYRREIPLARPLAAAAHASRSRSALAAIDPRITGAVALICVAMCCVACAALIGPFAALIPPALILLTIALTLHGVGLARKLRRKGAELVQSATAKPGKISRPAPVRTRIRQTAHPTHQRDAAIRLRRPA